ncbi:MAG: iron chaperone [Cyclobacteriaceae bacterium]
MQKINAENIDDYILQFPKEVQKLLKQIRSTIKKAAPKAQEAMKYGIPTFVLNGNLVHFAAYKSHIGFYPAPSGLQAFKKEIAKYKSSKGAVQFPLDAPLPLDLVSKIVKFRVGENSAKSK